MQTWIEDELATSDLGDERLDKRYRVLMDRRARSHRLAFRQPVRLGERRKRHTVFLLTTELKNTRYCILIRLLQWIESRIMT